MTGIVDREKIRKEMFLPDVRQVMEERRLHQRIQEEAPDPRWVGLPVLSRPLCCFEELLGNLPQNLFTIDWQGFKVFGRKLISRARLENRLLELNCSRIHDHMILGVFHHHEILEGSVRNYYHPLAPGERKALFAGLQGFPQADIFFPYVFLDPDGRERSSPREGWSLDPARAENLGEGERHLREYTVRRFQELGVDLNGRVLYDPACSTGQFLRTLKEHYPLARTIGQDLSGEMAAYARGRLDEVHHADARIDCVPASSVDAQFVRFLNSEVVKRQEAYDIFPKLVGRLKPGGYMVVFGHTPVLIHSSFMEAQGLEPIQKTGCDPSGQSIFQFYLYRRLL